MLLVKRFCPQKLIYSLALHCYFLHNSNNISNMRKGTIVTWLILIHLTLKYNGDKIHCVRYFSKRVQKSKILTTPMRLDYINFDTSNIIKYLFSPG